MCFENEKDSTSFKQDYNCRPVFENTMVAFEIDNHHTNNFLKGKQQQKRYC